jgi:hypothetical protein
VIISAATQRLIEGQFESQPFGSHLLKGIETPIAVYQAQSERQGVSSLAGRTTLTPLVGREQEVGLLLDRWGREAGAASPRASRLTPGIAGGAVQEAEGYFLQAIDVAQRQRAKSLELRAATSLARLWQQQGRTAEAHAVLSKIYDWFTEGFDTKDLQEAKALLAELAEAS